MLIKCPECELQVSDKAINCPHCGYPLKDNTLSKVVKKTAKKHRKLPNGFGQICKLNNPNLRNPFRVMVTIGKTEERKCICKILGYYDTYNHAYTALVEYNKNPYDLDKRMTVEELYNQWSPQYFNDLSTSSKKAISAAWRYCSVVYTMDVKEIRVRHIKRCMDDGFVIFKGEKKYASANIKALIKCLFNQMLDYALEYEIVTKNYSRDFTLSSDITKSRGTAKKGHIAFSNEEMDILWSNIDVVPNADLLVIQAYSGWRPQELGLLKLDRIDMENGFFIGGIKTDAGIDRIVPIHHRILPLIKNRYKEAVSLGSDYLFNYTESGRRNKSIKLTYARYSIIFESVCNILQLDPNHRPHDPRKHFVTMAKAAHVDEYALKYIVGHSIDDITEKVYTQREPGWLKAEIEKIE